MTEVISDMAVLVKNADGVWLKARALSGVEPTHRDGRKIHDFPVVWIEISNQRLPWPAEDVRPDGD